MQISDVCREGVHFPAFAGTGFLAMTKRDLTTKTPRHGVTFILGVFVYWWFLFLTVTNAKSARSIPAKAGIQHCL